MASNKGACKESQFLAVCTTPDVCKTPVGNTVVPIPYPITANLNDSMSASSNVNFGGAQAYKHDKSKVSKVTGDEPGTAGGVKSGTNRSIVETVEGSGSFQVNNKPAVRHGDSCKMNNGNTMGKVICQAPPGVAAGCGGSTNPPVTPETPQEEKAAQEKKKYNRNMSERRKALQRDAADPDSKLTKEQRDFIKENNGHRVPKDCEVAHGKPLYTKNTIEGKKALDTSDNMKTIPKTEHRGNHRPCGITYHDYPR